MKLWIKDGKLVVDGSGHPILCDTCPCSTPVTGYDEHFLYADGQLGSGVGSPPWLATSDELDVVSNEVTIAAIPSTANPPASGGVCTALASFTTITDLMGIVGTGVYGVRVQFDYTNVISAVEGAIQAADYSALSDGNRTIEYFASFEVAQFFGATFLFSVALAFSVDIVVRKSGGSVTFDPTVVTWSGSGDATPAISVAARSGSSVFAGPGGSNQVDIVRRSSDNHVLVTVNGTTVDYGNVGFFLIGFRPKITMSHAINFAAYSTAIVNPAAITYPVRLSRIVEEQP